MKKIIGVAVVLAVIAVFAAVYVKRSPEVPKAGGQAAQGAAVTQKAAKKSAPPKNDCEFRTKFADIGANYGKTWAYSSTDSLKMEAQKIALSDIDKLKREVFKTYSCLSVAGGKNRCDEFLGKSRKPEELRMREDCAAAYGRVGFMAYAAGDATKRDFCSAHYKYIVAEDSKYVSEEEFCSRAGKGLENLKDLCVKFPEKAKEQCLVYFDENKCKDCKSDWDLYRAFKNPENIKLLPPETQNEINALQSGSEEPCGEALVVSEYCSMTKRIEEHYNSLVAKKKK